VWDEAADFFTLGVLLALVDEAAGWAAGLGGEVIPRVGGGEEALPRECERNARRVHRDPSAAPLLGHVGGGT
jgi:hypothetical protein